ncbi:MAG: cupredoxin domain-containing protein [Armatimonadota bacterium]
MQHRTARWLSLLLAPCLALALLVGCAGDDTATTGNGPDTAANVPANTPEATMNGTGETREIQVVAEDMRYDPSEITVQPGEQVRVTLTNRGNSPHNIEFELPSGEVEFEEDLPPGETRSLDFQAPREPGRYTVYCPVGNHRELGMTGTLIVEAEGTGASSGMEGTEGTTGSGAGNMPGNSP